MLVEYHRNMLSDRPRNAAFHAALKKAVKKGDAVADIGAGTGFLGFLARRLGAKDVYLYEQAPVMALAQKTARDNRMTGCHFFHGHSTEALDAPPVDVIVTETLGNYAFEENIIATVEDAKRFLKPGGTVIPQQVEHVVAPVVSDRFFRELTVWDDVGYDLDFSAAKAMGLNNIYVRTFKDGELLEAKPWDKVDFRRKNTSKRKGRAEWKLAKDATVYGFAVWWNCTLVPGITLSTGPQAPKTHWEQLYFPVLEPIAARKGDVLGVSIASASSYEGGTTIDWRVSLKKAGGGKSREQVLSLEKGYLG